MAQSTMFRRGSDSFTYNFTQSSFIGFLLGDDLINGELVSFNKRLAETGFSMLVIAAGVWRDRHHREKWVMGLLGSCFGLAMGMKLRVLGEPLFRNERGELLSLPTVSISCDITIKQNRF